MNLRPDDQHICFIFAALGLGGAEAQFELYFRNRPPGVAISVVYFNDMYDDRPDSMLPRLQALGVEVHYCPLAKAGPVGLYRLVDLLKRLQPAMVHTVLAGSSGTWGRLAAWLAGVPVIFHSDRSLNPPVSLPHRVLRPVVNQMTHQFLTNAVAIADWLTGLGVPRHKVITIPNGVDLERFTPANMVSRRRELNIAAQAVVAGFLGKFRPEKRLDLLLDALIRLPESERPDYVLLGGDGPVMEQIRERVSQHPWLKEHCRLMGLISDVPGFLALVDYLILCSDREGLPNVVLEAMAMGRPVVSTAVSDVPQLLQGVGFLAEPGDVHSLAQAVQAMQHLTPAERTHMGDRAREKITTGHAIAGVAARFWEAHAHKGNSPCTS